jgi:hypothetical protein
MIDTDTDGREVAESVIACLTKLYGLETAAESTPKAPLVSTGKLVDTLIVSVDGPTTVYGDTSSEGSRDIPAAPTDVTNDNVVQLFGAPPPPAEFAGDVEVEDDTAGSLPPPPPSAPQPPAPPVATQVDYERDARGLPWDGRIHASNRAKTIKGEWKYKRGVDKNLVTAVEAGNVPGNLPEPTVKVAGVPTALSNVGAAVEALKAAPPAPAPSAPVVDSSTPPPPPASAVKEPVTFRGLMQKIMKNPNVFTDEKLAEVLGQFGLTSADLVKLMDNPLLPSVNAAVDACLGS